jgi:hypothetical protein
VKLDAPEATAGCDEAGKTREGALGAATLG